MNFDVSPNVYTWQTVIVNEFWHTTFPKRIRPKASIFSLFQCSIGWMHITHSKAALDTSLAYFCRGSDGILSSRVLCLSLCRTWQVTPQTMLIVITCASCSPHQPPVVIPPTSPPPPGRRPLNPGPRHNTICRQLFPNHPTTFS